MLKINDARMQPNPVEVEKGFLVIVEIITWGAIKKKIYLEFARNGIWHMERIERKSCDNGFVKAELGQRKRLQDMEQYGPLRN